jgi:hypothetical protein
MARFTSLVRLEQAEPGSGARVPEVRERHLPAAGALTAADRTVRPALLAARGGGLLLTADGADVREREAAWRPVGLAEQHG